MADRTEVKYDFTPRNPDPGDDYDKWRQDAHNAMASGDDRGWSLADHVLASWLSLMHVDGCERAPSTLTLARTLTPASWPRGSR